MIRLLDIIFSSLALMLFLPIFILLTLTLKITGEGEIFFLQDRVGQRKKKFKVIKFATMLKDSPNIGSGSITSKDDPRILPVGRLLRKTKINEMPQLINVIVGQMSLIGPRPHAERDLQGIDKVTLDEVLMLKPGLSGIGSIIFRNEEEILQTFENPRPFYDQVIAPYKAQLELWYCRNRSPMLYFALIYLTIINVIKPDMNNLFRLFPNLPRLPHSLRKYFDLDAIYLEND